MEILTGLILVALGIFGVWVLLEFPGFAIFLIIVIIIIGSCVDDVEETATEVINEQILEANEPEPKASEVPADSVNERCLDGIVYLLIVEDGQSFMAPKEDTFGYNEKCSQ